MRNINNSKIQIAVPTRGRPHAATVLALQRIRDSAAGLRPIWYEMSNISAADCRNRIVRRFLESAAEILIMVDDDVIPNLDILGLAKRDADLDVVGLPVLIQRGEANIPFPNVYSWDERNGMYAPIADTFAHLSAAKLVRCDAVGTGAICIARRVLEHEDMRPAFEFICGKDGVVHTGEDVNFCARARKVGFRIFADYSLRSEHLAETAVWDNMRRLGEANFQIARVGRDAPEPSSMIVPPPSLIAVAR